MADKKDQRGLEGKNVEIFLQTPLFRFKYLIDEQEEELLENAVRISGKVLQDQGAGLLMEVKVLSNMKKQQKDLPFDEIFIPYAKIDFVVVQ